MFPGILLRFAFLLLPLLSFTHPLRPRQIPARLVRMAIAGLNHDHAAFFFGKKFRPGIQLVGIYEPNPVLVRRYEIRYQLPANLFYSNLDRMLDAVRPEAVVAFCSTDAHLSVVKACAPRGIHVMVEKPLSTTVNQALEMKRLADRYRIFLLTDYETAWYPSTEKAFRLVLDSGYVGTIRKVIFHDGHQGPVAIHVSPEFLAWLTDPVKNGGGALMDFGCYGANLMDFLMQGQKPLGVTAVTRHFQPRVYPRVDDEATILVSYPSAQCLIEASWNWPFGRKDMEIYGDKGYVKTLNNTDLREKDMESVPETDLEITAGEVQVIQDPFVYFARVVRKEMKMPAYGQYSLENNIEVVRILDAARRSAATGRTVSLSSVPDSGNSRH